MKMPDRKALPGLFWNAGRILAGIVFAYAGFAKLMEPVENVRGIIASYETIPYVLVTPLSYLVPWMELFLGLFLLLGFALRVSALGAALMCAGFLTLIVLKPEFWSGEVAHCGCFGDEGVQLTLRQMFLLDSVNLVTLLHLFWTGRPDWGLEKLLK